jgi:hypothetical protein
MFKPGDKVEIVEKIPDIITSVIGLTIGMQGEVKHDCPCFTLLSDIIERPCHYTRVFFGNALKAQCVPTRILKLVPGDDESVGGVDWSKIPKPWEIGVKG